MKLSSIKTKTQFWELGDNWYQRTHRLREVWQDDSLNYEKRFKAFRLWNVMLKRVLYLSNEAVKLTVVKLN